MDMPLEGSHGETGNSKDEKKLLKFNIKYGYLNLCKIARTSGNLRVCFCTILTKIALCGGVRLNKVMSILKIQPS